MSAAARLAPADDPCGFLYALAARSPGADLPVRIGEIGLLVLQAVASAEHVLLASPGTYRKNIGSLRPVFGVSRLTVDPPAWKPLQRVTQPYIAPRDREGLAAAAAAHYRAFADALPANPAGHPIDPLIDRAAIGTVAAAALSTPLEAFGPTFAADLRTFVRHSALGNWSPTGLPPADPAAEAAGARVKAAVAEIAAARARERDPPDDALTTILRAEGAPGLDPLGEIMTLVVAGSDTAGASLGWALSILAENPAYQERLRAGIAAALGDTPATAAGIARVPELDLFIEETLRLYPPVPMISRIAAIADRIGGHAVAPRDRLLISIIGIHQNPTLWPDPRRFDPGRHHRRPPGLAFAAFSGGSRICGGLQFGRIELAIALIEVLRRCRVAPLPSGPLRFEWGASMRRAGGHHLRAEPLASA